MKGVMFVEKVVANRPFEKESVLRLVTPGANGGKTILGPANIFGGRVTSSLRSQDGAGITVEHARATDEAMKCAKSGNCDATLVIDTAPTDGAPVEITMRRTVDLCAFLELPEEARALVIAAKKREFGEMEE